jgi:hypothetical protein
MDKNMKSLAGLVVVGVLIAVIVSEFKKRGWVV